MTSARAGEIGITWIGHATVLIDLGNARILTDPFLRDRLGPLKRHGPVPNPDTIGAVDVVSISHAHPDHFDLRSLASLPGDPLVVVPRGLGGAVRRIGRRAVEVVVGDATAVAPGWTIRAVPARHWRWPAAPRAATIGYLLEGPGHAGIYFAGDTGPFDAMGELAGSVDIALLPVGSWGPHRTPGHLTPRTAARAARDLGARIAIPIHWGTLFPPGLSRLAGRRLTEPGRQFAAWSARLAPALSVHVLAPGATVAVSPPDAPG